MNESTSLDFESCGLSPLLFLGDVRCDDGEVADVEESKS